MIGRLTGSILECSPGEVLLDVGGVGYAVRIPLGTFYEIQKAQDGPVSLHVHTHVREEALQLYGFATREERGAFEKLIGISGVGPRLALAVLSGIGVGELERAASDGDRARLERIPGIGRKTAERVLLELRDRFAREGRAGKRAEPRRAGSADTPARDRGSDALSALVNLGYAPEVAGRAVEDALAGAEDGASLEAILREALRKLLR